MRSCVRVSASASATYAIFAHQIIFNMFKATLYVDHSRSIYTLIQNNAHYTHASNQSWQKYFSHNSLCDRPSFSLSLSPSLWCVCIPHIFYAFFFSFLYTEKNAVFSCYFLWVFCRMRVFYSLSNWLFNHFQCVFHRQL